MQINVRMKNLELTPEVVDLIRDRARRAMDRLGDHFTELRLLIEDINGPRGGVDIRCRAVARRTGGARVVATRLAPAVLDAVDLAVGTLAEALHARVCRARTSPIRSRRRLRAMTGGRVGLARQLA